jgi:hypothetical protein
VCLYGPQRDSLQLKIHDIIIVVPSYLRSPWYHVLVAAMLIVVLILGGLAGSELLGVNPYVTAALAGAAFLVYEAWQVSRHP